ncbi:TetR/AcrR family transcriptional regulator [Halanaerobium hydrogeniformans]|uniref:Transcriptional regulator, TetR family n=1 Tax=Halanaerobium hydrogeniformans TaxID=656519 RepID=E4RNT6_HALHG|nr:TetR/AcrR family transcriptional regulator [Halanaerobium hydrogeniformans]ADQ13764.1 transcriptional regulator, TetR family [Halanaerobium hydrogeniformans]
MQTTKQEIFNAARELFIEKGFKKTNISEITAEVGIAVGSFYNFYSSKEEVFMDVFVKEDQALKKRIKNSINFDGDISTVVKELIKKLHEGMKNNPILVEWYKKEDFKTITKKVGEPYVDEVNEGDAFYSFFLEIVGKWQSEGKLDQHWDKEYILALFNSVAFIDLHKDEIGEEYFPELLEDLIKFIVRGLEP